MRDEYRNEFQSAPPTSPRHARTHALTRISQLKLNYDPPCLNAHKKHSEISGSVGTALTKIVVMVFSENRKRMNGQNDAKWLEYALQWNVQIDTERLDYAMLWQRCYFFLCHKYVWTSNYQPCPWRHSAITVNYDGRPRRLLTWGTTTAQQGVELEILTILSLGCVRTRKFIFLNHIVDPSIYPFPSCLNALVRDGTRLH